MAFVVQPSKNKMLDAAWKGFRKEQRAEKKAPKEEATLPAAVHRKPPKVTAEAPHMHKRPGKVNTPAPKAKKRPAKKAAAKKARRAK